MTFSSQQARTAAEELLGVDPKGFTFAHLDTKHRPGLWVVVFAVYSPEGTEVDGPIVVVVNELTGKAQSLDEYIELKGQPP